MFPWYIWFLGICVQSYLTLPLSILVCQAPSPGTCTIGISSLWKNDRVHLSWLDCYLYCIFVRVWPLFFCYVYPVCRWWRWRFSGQRNFSRWSDMRLWNFSSLALVLYLCIRYVCAWFHCMDAVVVLVPLCHLVWCGVPSRVVAFLRTLGSYIF